MAETDKPKISALAMATQSNEFASVSWTPEDVRQLRPAWSGPEAQYFLGQHQAELAHIMLEMGRRALELLIQHYEKEAR